MLARARFKRILPDEIAACEEEPYGSPNAAIQPIMIRGEAATSDVYEP